MAKGDIQRARRQVQEKLEERESVPTRFRALTGDGKGNIIIPGKRNFIYVRIQGRSRVDECLNVKIPRRNNLPVIVGYTPENPETLQILSTDWAGMAKATTYPYIPFHHETHEFQHPAGGDDVVWIQSQQLLPFLVHPTDPPSLQVNIFGGWYPWLGSWHYFEEDVSADLSGYIPLNLGAARFLLISVNGADESLQYTVGPSFPNFLPPPNRELMIPAAPDGSIPSAAIYLPFGLLSIDWDNLYDVRLFTQPTGGSVLPAVHTHADPSQGGQLDWDLMWADGVHNHSSDAEGGPNLHQLLELEFKTPSTLTISSGIVTRTQVYHRIDTEGYIPLDELETVNGGTVGDLLIIHPFDGSRDIVVKHGVGNLWMTGGLDVLLDDLNDHLALVYDGTKWASIGGEAGAGANLIVSGPGNPVFRADGALVVQEMIDNAYIVPGPLTIAYAYIHCNIPGTAGSTIVDVNINGVSIFTTQANRPILPFDDPDKVAKSGVPDIVGLLEGDVITVDIDQIAEGAEDLSVLVAFTTLPDVYHLRLHAITSADDHAAAGAALDLVGLTAVDTLGMITPSFNPDSTAKILRTDTSGIIQLRGLWLGKTGISGNVWMLDGGRVAKPYGPHVKVGDGDDYLRIEDCQVGFGLDWLYNPQGRIHGYGTSGGFLFWNQEDIGGTPIVVVPDGWGDVTRVLTCFGVAAIQDAPGAGYFSIGTTPPGLVVLYETPPPFPQRLLLRVVENGEVTVFRDTGDRYWTVAMWMIWI